jgi:hypothetical protein
VEDATGPDIGFDGLSKRNKSVKAGMSDNGVARSWMRESAKKQVFDLSMKRVGGDKRPDSMSDRNNLNYLEVLNEEGNDGGGS